MQIPCCFMQAARLIFHAVYLSGNTSLPSVLEFVSDVRMLLPSPVPELKPQPSKANCLTPTALCLRRCFNINTTRTEETSNFLSDSKCRIFKCSCYVVFNLGARCKCNTTMALGKLQCLELDLKTFTWLLNIIGGFVCSMFTSEKCMLLI